MVFAFGLTIGTTFRSKPQVQIRDIEDIRQFSVHVPFQDSPDGKVNHVIEVYEVTDPNGEAVFNLHANVAPVDFPPVWRIDFGGYRYFGTVKPRQ